MADNFWGDLDKETSQAPSTTTPSTTSSSSGFWDSLDNETTPAESALTPTSGSITDHIKAVSEKYNVNPKILQDFAVDQGSMEAAEARNDWFSSNVPDVVKKAGAAVSGAAEAITMGVPTKIYKKTMGITAGDNYEKALDEIQNIVDERKSLVQKGGEFVTSLAGAPLKAGAQLTTKALVGTGASMGAAGGFGGSSKGNELQDTAIGGALGTGLGLAPMAVKKLAPGLGKWNADELIEDFMRPKSKELQQQLVEGDKSRINKIVKDVGDYVFKRNPDLENALISRSDAPGETMNLGEGLQRSLFKASSREKLIKNVNQEIQKLSNVADTHVTAWVEAHGDEAAQELSQSASKMVDDFGNSLLKSNAAHSVGQKEWKNVTKALQEVSKRIQAAAGDPEALINIKKSLQKEVDQGYEVGKKLSSELQTKKALAAKLNEVIYDFDPRAKVLNKYISSLLNYQDSISRNPNSVSDSIKDLSRNILHIGRAAGSYSLINPATGAVAAADSLLNTDLARLAKIQFGSKAVGELLRKSSPAAIGRTTSAVGQVVDEKEEEDK